MKNKRLKIARMERDMNQDALADVGISTAVFFLINFILGESKVRKYNSYMKKLEEEENDIS